jgi:hypothetical protein
MPGYGWVCGWVPTSEGRTHAVVHAVVAMQQGLWPLMQLRDMLKASLNA